MRGVFAGLLLLPALVTSTAAGFHVTASDVAVPKPSSSHTRVSTGLTNANFFGVSCTSATTCTAVGGYTNSAGAGVTLAEVWNGTRWLIQHTRNPTGATSSTLSGVSCTSPIACIAVGNANTVTLAEAWNGTRWSIQHTPNPASASSSKLASVSCRSATACTAVGSYLGSADVPVPFAEIWNGIRWVLSAPKVVSSAGGNGLDSVSCASAVACAAVGSVLSPSGEDFPLAESWNGAHWVVRATPNPSGSESSGLYGVSCPSATSKCTAVGFYQDNLTGPSFTLAEAWNGTHWSLQPTPNPAGTTGSILFGVSCVSATACTAVGDAQTKTKAELLAESWNRTNWSITDPRTGSRASGGTATTGDNGTEMHAIEPIGA
jgi:hypothetical protein